MNKLFALNFVIVCDKDISDYLVIHCDIFNDLMGLILMPLFRDLLEH